MPPYHANIVYREVAHDASEGRLVNHAALADEAYAPAAEDAPIEATAPAAARTPASPVKLRRPLLYGPRWLHDEAVKRLEMLQEPLYRFARLVAGCSNMSLDALLEPLDSGLEQYIAQNGDTLESFVEEFSREEEQDTQSEEAGDTTDETNLGPYQVKREPIGAALRQFTTEKTPRRRALYATLALALQRRGVLSPEMIDGFRALEASQRRMNLAEIKWLSLPRHLGYVFFKPSLQAAFETAYEDVRSSAERADLTFYDLIVHPELRTRFAQLVSNQIAVSKNDLPTRYMRDKARRVAVAERRALLRFFRSVVVERRVERKRPYSALY